jgi:hypothetical protein
MTQNDISEEPIEQVKTNQLLEKAKRLAAKTAQHAYVGVAILDEKSKTGEGVVGIPAQSVRGMYNQGKLVIKTAKAANKLKNKIPFLRKKEEPTQSTGRRFVHAVHDATANLAGRAVDRVKGDPQSVDDIVQGQECAAQSAQPIKDGKLTTDGSYDKDKGKAYLDKGMDITGKLLGSIAGRVATGIKNGSSVIAEDYHNVIPNQEEKKSKYAGLGSALEKEVFVRRELDLCLDFHDFAQTYLFEGRLGDRNDRCEVLADIKAYVIKDSMELGNLYGSKGLEGSKVVLAEQLILYGDKSFE